MRPVFVAVGALVLVLGGTLVAFAPFYVSTGFYKAELNSIQSFNSSTNTSSALSSYSSYADTGELIALVGTIIAPVGAAMLAYGLSKGKTEEKQTVPTTQLSEAS